MRSPLKKNHLNFYLNQYNFFVRLLKTYLKEKLNFKYFSVR